jgi:hypothetical protein
MEARFEAARARRLERLRTRRIADQFDETAALLSPALERASSSDAAEVAYELELAARLGDDAVAPPRHSFPLQESVQHRRSSVRQQSRKREIGNQK